MEGLTIANTGKLLRALRLGGFIEIARGQTGGYKLSHPASEIIIGEVLAVPGGRLFEARSLCRPFRLGINLCTHN